MSFDGDRRRVLRGCDGCLEQGTEGGEKCAPKRSRDRHAGLHCGDQGRRCYHAWRMADLPRRLRKIARSKWRTVGLGRVVMRLVGFRFPRHARVRHRSRGYAEPRQDPQLQHDPSAQNAECGQHTVLLLIPVSPADAGLAKNRHHRTPLRKRRLEQVQSHEQREPQEVRVDVDPQQARSRPRSRRQSSAANVQQS